MVAHAWPGTVRARENRVTRAVVLATGEVIRPEHLGLRTADGTSPESFPTLEQSEANLVLRALSATQGNRTRAAEILGISKPRLYRMLERYGIS
jgi:two-component system NtrC family response regulator